MAGASGGAPAVRGECVGDWKAGTYPADFITGGGTSTLPAIGGRNYAVHVPKDYDCQVPTPLLYGLHGLGMSGYSFNVGGTSTPKRSGGLVAKADEEGFILVMPTGLGPSAADVQVIKDIFKNLETHLNIDHKRVYATGISNGAGLAHRLACEAADVFAAIAAASADLVTDPCTPARPISELSVRGESDTLVAYAGGNTGSTGWYSPGAKGTLELWKKIDGCTGPVQKSLQYCETYTGCMAGVEVTLCSLPGVGHILYDNPLDFDVPNIAWEMFKRQPMP